MEVSVIVPTYNEKKEVEDCIESLGAQSLKDFEIIIVDDGSTDGTLEVLRDLQSSIPNFHFMHQHHEGAGASRNLGASKAKGKILVFVDADMTFDVDFLLKLIAPIKGSAKGTFSKEEFVSNWKNVWARCWNINQGWEEGRRHPKNFPDTQPVFRAILKSEFDKVKGFTPGGYDDDWSLYRKLGYKAVNASGAIFYHKNPDNLGEVFVHSKWAAKRKYKFGFIGAIYNLLIYSLPDSLWQGFWKSIFKGEPLFIIFKVVYDFGATLGIIEQFFKNSGAK